MKVQTCGDTCEGACAAEQHTKNTMQPGWPGSFLLSLMRTDKHSHLACCSWLSSKNDSFTRILDGVYELWCAPTKNTRSHRQHRCFWILALSWQCILTHSASQDGLVLVRNTNLSTLSSEKKWYQNILIELLTVLLLLQPHIHISSCSSLHSSKRKQDS
jgi:hypothetical protein